MNVLEGLIFKDLFNIIDDNDKIEIINCYPHSLQLLKNPSQKIQLFAVMGQGDTIQYIKNPSEAVKFEAIKENPYSIIYIKQPSEKAQLEVIKNIMHIDKYFMNKVYHKINYCKALNLLFKKVPEQYKEQIKSHPNYKSDAQLVLDLVKK